MSKIVSIDYEKKTVKFETVSRGQTVFVEFRGQIPCYLRGGVCGNAVIKIGGAE